MCSKGIGGGAAGRGGGGAGKGFGQGAGSANAPPSESSSETPSWLWILIGVSLFVLILFWFWRFAKYCIDCQCGPTRRAHGEELLDGEKESKVPNGGVTNKVPPRLWSPRGIYWTYKSFVGDEFISSTFISDIEADISRWRWILRHSWGSQTTLIPLTPIPWILFCLLIRISLGMSSSHPHSFLI